MTKDYVEWDKENGPDPKKAKAASKAESDKQAKTTFMRQKMSTTPAGYIPYS